ncbi:MAG TPA: nucleoside triphosphate pyrophosphohydrolase family protein [Promineifilum sp.]|nr:nucleoside triphosphate pyrophosphohydrolase family protein [Promineifilum sp.]
MNGIENENIPDAMQRQALRTWHNTTVSLREQRIHALLGLAGETGELVDLLKKHFYKPDREATREMVMDELADVLYYVAILSHLWGFTFEDMTAHLAVKLADNHGWDGSGEKVAAQTDSSSHKA